MVDSCEEVVSGTSHGSEGPAVLTGWSEGWERKTGFEKEGGGERGR